MSNANFYGRVDRRIPVNAVPITVQDSFEQIYSEFTEVQKRDRSVIEIQATSAAYRGLDAADQVRIDSCRQALIKKVGKNFGEVSANQILTRLGIFLIKAGFRGQGSEFRGQRPGMKKGELAES